MTTLRKQTYHFLEISAGQRKGAVGIFNVAIFTLIFLNTIAIVLHSVESIGRPYDHLFQDFEIFSVIVFTIEYLLRLWCCVENHRFSHPVWGRLKYMFQPSSMVDLLSFMPFYLTMFTADLALVRVLRLLRIFRLMKVTRYVFALKLIENVIKDKKEELLVSLVVTLFAMLISSSVMFYVEHEAQPKVFSSIPATMWWGVATFTTVGYGDAVPITPLGKLCGGVIALMGVGLFALPTGILASGFAEEITRHRRRRIIKCPHCGVEIDIDLEVHQHRPK